MFDRLKDYINRNKIQSIQKNINNSAYENIIECFCEKNVNDLPPVYNLSYCTTKQYKIERDAEYLWNAAVRCGSTVYGIPSGSTRVLKINLLNNNVTYIGNLSNQNKKWTGGGLYKDKVYGFLRCANELLVIDTKTDEINIVSIGCNYQKEHHYGGVIYKGFIYQPPRDEDHILCVDLASYRSRKIYLGKNVKFRYCGSFLHPSGLIYFLPELDEKVTVFNPETEEIMHIGEPIDAMTFSVSLALDNNLYGFSAYKDGILKIDTRLGSAGMIHEEIGCPGVYKNILHYDGKIYGIPGNGNNLWVYDVLEDKVDNLDIFPGDEGIPKIASGCLYEEDIIGLPAKCNYWVRLQFENQTLKRDCCNNDGGGITL